ncbi:hypothetical protein EPUL_004015, partial [Erysiphe pulchra]
MTNIIDNQINLPGAEDFVGWSEMTNSIARNLKKQNHIAKLNQQPNTNCNVETPLQPAFDIGDPMDLSRPFSRDHRRKINPIPMLKRPKSSFPTNGSNSGVPNTSHPSSPNTPLYNQMPSLMFYPPMYPQQFSQRYPQQFIQPYPQPFQRQYFQTPGFTHLRAFPDDPDVITDYQVNSISSQDNKDKIDHKVEQQLKEKSM